MGLPRHSFADDRNWGLLNQGAGRKFVSLEFTSSLSASVTTPLALTSVLKFAALAGCASWALTWNRSESVTTRLALTSPARNPIRTDPLPPVPPSTDETPVSATVTYC